MSISKFEEQQLGLLEKYALQSDQPIGHYAKLWRQIRAGECHLMTINDEIFRCVYAVVVRIFSPTGDKELLEIEKRDGEAGVVIEQLYRPMGEKIKSEDKSCIAAAVRGIREELGIRVEEQLVRYVNTEIEVGFSKVFDGKSLRLLLHCELQIDAQHYQETYVEKREDGSISIFEWVSKAC